MRQTIFFVIITIASQLFAQAQVKVDMKAFKASPQISITQKNESLVVKWTGTTSAEKLEMVLNLKEQQRLFESLSINEGAKQTKVLSKLDPAFIITVSTRDLISQNGWNIFFDRVQNKPRKEYLAEFRKSAASVKSKGNRAVITIGELTAGDFRGELQITIYPGTTLFNIAAVMSTKLDSAAYYYDAGLIGDESPWKTVSYMDVEGKTQQSTVQDSDTAMNIAVKHRVIAAGNGSANLAVFPSPHQYFFPLDEAFNLKFVWHGSNYRKLFKAYGIGIRQHPQGDNRFVPWVNAPPGTLQRMDFYCEFAGGDVSKSFAKVKRYTNSDQYPKVAGYKTLASHFHNEHVMTTVLAGKPNPDTPNFVKVFKALGVDIVHLGEFHYTAHPKGPDSLRIKELKTLFDECRRLSKGGFLLLPGEEPNEFLGGHWLQFFPKPVYWIMSRKPDQPFVTDDPKLGKIYRIGNSAEMLELLKLEKGLAWTAHPRTKGSTGFPDKYKEQEFFKSDRFFGAAWKSIPADMSQPILGKRVLDLLDDMNNWGAHKKILAEADLFTVEPQNEMWAHMNINYLKLDKIPDFDAGWPSIIETLNNGRFFSSTGEIIIPKFTIDNKETGDTVRSKAGGKSTASFQLKWTFPLNYAEIVSGDGSKVYRDRINLDTTNSFGEKTFTLPLNLSGRKWARLEVWDVAANGAFTQAIWVE